MAKMFPIGSERRNGFFNITSNSMPDIEVDKIPVLVFYGKHGNLTKYWQVDPVGLNELALEKLISDELMPCH